MYFTTNTLPKFNLSTCNFQNSFHKLSLISLSLSLSLCICIYEFYSIKPSDITENKIYVKVDLKAANTAHPYHLKSGTIYSQWNYYFKKLNWLDSHKFAHFTAYLIVPLYIFHILFIYISYSRKKTKLFIL